MNLNKYFHASVLLTALRLVRAEIASYNSSGIANRASAYQTPGAHTVHSLSNITHLPSNTTHSPKNATKVLSDSSSSCVLYSEDVQLRYFDECEAGSDPLEDVTAALDDYTL